MSELLTVPVTFPRFRAVAAQGLLVEFGETIDMAIHDRVLQLDQALSRAAIPGFVEAIPAYASLMVCFDPIVTDHVGMHAAIQSLIDAKVTVSRTSALREVEVCYDADLGPDLRHVAEATGLSPDQVIDTHLAGRYGVYMYGFAPGYAYMAGVPPQIQLPRKGSAVRGVPSGSVIVAGPQCLVTTLTMPTGWWVIGRSPTPILSDDPERPFLFDIGDTVVFRRIDRTNFDRQTMPA